ncbi:hypothetical protein C8Q70DRAFT_541997 [Cubamyces menziesii]|nr:hypothetical protein C8Q70DRAFT_541997 [Cubamyces menziesii]
MSQPASDTLSTLPTELLNIIARNFAKADLASLLLVNKSINDALTPLLYASITIRSYISGQKCIDVLAADPTEHFADRDMAVYVRSFTVDLKKLKYWRKGVRAAFACSLEGAISRMTGLQSFALQSMFFGTPKICIALMRGASRTLRSLSFTAETERQWPDESDVRALDGFQPELPELTTLSLKLANFIPLQFYTFFQHVLTSRSAQLHILSIYDSHNRSVGDLFPNTGAWSALEELDLSMAITPTFFDDCPPGLNVCKLTLRPSFCLKEGTSTISELPSSIPAHIFPNIQYLACPYQLLPAFLPVSASSRRPIRTVRLNQAYYDPHGQSVDSFTDGGGPPWSSVRGALNSLSRSAGPVVDLAFYIECFDAETFPGELVEYVRTVERLVIVLQREPLNGLGLCDFGEKLFAHTPRLRAFLLSDAPTRAIDDEFAFFTFLWDEHKTWLEEWEKHTGVLEEVAFTTEHSWKKMDDGWVKRGYDWAESNDTEDDSEYGEDDEVVKDGDWDVDDDEEDNDEDEDEESEGLHQIDDVDENDEGKVSG